MGVHYKIFKQCIYLWVLLLLHTSLTAAQFYSFHEGDEAIMTFQYEKAQVRDHTVEIQQANRIPFYIRGNISNDGLTDDQLGRFTVKEHEKTDTERNEYFIIVQIENVTRNDGGTYICTVYQNSRFVRALTQRIGLTVNFPPGKASCHFVDNASEIDKEWTKIECIASLGNYLGFIDCYQIEGKMPHFTDVTYNHTHLMQLLLVRKYKPAMCCTTNYVRPTKDCACNDFMWDPFNQNLTTLCPKEEADFEPVITDPSMRSDHMSSSVSTLTQQRKNFSTEAVHTQNQCICSDMRVIWFITGGLVSIAIMAAVWFACHMKRINYMSSNAKQSPEKEQLKSTTESKYVATEEQPTHILARKKIKFTKSRPLTPESKYGEVYIE